MGILKKIIERSSLTSSQKKVMKSVTANQLNSLDVVLTQNASQYQSNVLIGANVLFLITTADGLDLSNWSFNPTTGTVTKNFVATVGVTIVYKA